MSNPTGRDSDVAALQARIRNHLDEAAASRPQWSTEEARKWSRAIGSAGQEIAKANLLVAGGKCSVQETAEHRKLAARMLAAVQDNASRSLDSLELGQFAIDRAFEEFKRRWGATESTGGT
jgi:hypothetical protein